MKQETQKKLTTGSSLLKTLGAGVLTFGLAMVLSTVSAQTVDLVMSKVITSIDGAPISTPNTGALSGANSGDTVIFTLTATPDATIAATGVVVEDPVPAGLTVTACGTSSGSMTAGTMASNTCTWNIGNMAAGGAAETMTVTATVN